MPFDVLWHCFLIIGGRGQKDIPLLNRLLQALNLNVQHLCIFIKYAIAYGLCGSLLCPNQCFGVGQSFSLYGEAVFQSLDVGLGRLSGLQQSVSRRHRLLEFLLRDGYQFGQRLLMRQLCFDGALAYGADIAHMQFHTHALGPVAHLLLFHLECLLQRLHRLFGSQHLRLHGFCFLPLLRYLCGGFLQISSQLPVSPQFVGTMGDSLSCRTDIPLERTHLLALLALGRQLQLLQSRLFGTDALALCLQFLSALGQFLLGFFVLGNQLLVQSLCGAFHLHLCFALLPAAVQHQLQLARDSLHVLIQGLADCFLV